MLRHKKFRPYIRRLRPSDKAESIRMALRLAFYQEMGWDGYVMVQHGFPNIVMEVGRTKREVMESPLVVALGIKSFKQWAKDTQKYCEKN